MSKISQAVMDVAPLRLRNCGEHRRLRKLREDAFTPWVRGLPPRWSINAASRYYRGFFLEARRTDDRLAGFLFTAPMNWDGDVNSLTGYEEMHVLLYRRIISTPVQWLRGRRRRNFDTLVLMTVLVDPDFRGRQVPAALIQHARQRAAAMGCRHIISPFRPSGYGRYKQEGRRAHSEETFLEYCRSTDDSGLLIDPWLLSLSRNGMTMLKPAMKSVRRARSVRYFERFRRTYRSDAWYETSDGVWECGEVATWHVDASAGRVWLIEPNMWGTLPVPTEG